MGVVFEAVDPTIGRTVAIKTVRLREVDDSDQRNRLRERLFREARSAGVLSHPNIVTIYDMDEEDGVAYIAMQFVNGPTVEALQEKQDSITPERIFRIIRQTAAGLDFAHSKGIVHRDIKPANIMIDDDGTVKIADFGIAKAGASGNLTGSGTIIGTPNYMSPEQVQGTAISGRSDQFSLGVVAYELLAGERPFSGENLGTIVYRIVAEPAPEPAQVNPALGAEISRVLQKALEKNPKRRFATCTEFAEQLIAACEATPGWHLLARVNNAELFKADHLEAEPEVVSPAPSVPRPTTAATPAAVLSKPAATSAPAVATVEKSKQRAPASSSLFAPALGAFAVVLTIIGLVAWQTNGPSQPVLSANAKPPAAVSPAIPEDLEMPPSASEIIPPANSSSEPAVEPQVSAKPEPLPHKPITVQREVVAKPARKRSPFLTPAVPGPLLARVKAPESVLQDVSVVTNPPGATATLDGQRESACATPCMLLSEPGIHLLSLTLKDFQPERRQLRVAGEREEVPLITLRPVGGTLMLSTVPPGANVFVNDRMLTELTPAQLSLQPGRYTIAVERDGTRKSQEVVVKNGATNYLRIPFPE